MAGEAGLAAGGGVLVEHAFGDRGVDPLLREAERPGGLIGVTESAASTAFFDRVFNSDRIALLRNWRFSFCRFRLICDLMLAIGDLVFGGRAAFYVGIPPGWHPNGRQARY